MNMQWNRNDNEFCNEFGQVKNYLTVIFEFFPSKLCHGADFSTADISARNGRITMMKAVLGMVWRGEHNGVNYI